MKKSNVILQAAIASALLAMAGTACATTVTVTAPVFAKELLQGTTPNATVLTIPAAGAITVVANTAIPANSTVYVYVKLNGASISTIPSVAPGIASAIVAEADGTGAGAAGVSITLTAASLGSTTGTVAPAAVGAGVDYVVFKLSTVAVGIGVGGTVAIIGGAASGGGTSVPLDVNNAASLLTAPLTATASVGVGAPAARFGTLPAAASNYDAASAATTIATNAQGITLAAAASTNAGKIDLTSTPVATLFDASAINTNTINLGTITATNNAAVKADGATAYTIASQATGATKLTATVTAPAGFFAPLGTTGQLWLQNTCGAAGATGAANAGALAGSPTTVFGTAALAAAATSVTLNATAAPVSATVYNVCMGITKTIAAIEGTPTLAGSLVHASTTIDSSNAFTATLYPVLYNGQTIDVRNYVPAAATGYNTFVRVINTGAVSAAVSVALIDATTGTAGTAGLLGTLAAGAARNFTPTEIEAVTGAVAATARPRLRITAPTNAMNVQTFLAQPVGAGTIVDMSGAQ